MKSCPTCNRTYADDTITFCLIDGAILSAPFDPHATLQLPTNRATNPPPTEILPPGTVRADFGHPPMQQELPGIPQILGRTANQKSAALPLKQPKAFQTILYAGLLAGTLDITAAFVTALILSGTNPLRILRFIASGLLGPSAINGGMVTATLGLLLHFIIAIGAAAVFYMASRVFKFLLQSYVISGLLFGVVWYLFMNSIVLPLSAIPRKGYPAWPYIVLGMITIMVCVGLPIALVVNYYSKEAAQGNGRI